LLIKHRDDWAGPVDITEFAPLSVKTPEADFADILAADNPAVWRSNAPAKSGDAGKLFQRIIAQAVAMKVGGAERTKRPATVAKGSAPTRKAKARPKGPKKPSAGKKTTKPG
jgi:hypothetical protein